MSPPMAATLPWPELILRVRWYLRPLACLYTLPHPSIGQRKRFSPGGC